MRSDSLQKLPFPFPFLALAAILAGGPGCATGDDAAPAGGPGVPLQLRASTSALASDGSGAPALTDDAGVEHVLASVRANVRDVELDLPAGVRCADIEAELAGGARCDSSDDSGGAGEDKVIVDGPFLVDLLAGTATPDLSAVRVPDLAYARVDLRLEPDEAGALEGASFVAETAFDRAGVPTPLVLALSFNEDLRIEQPGGVRVQVGAPLLVHFDASGWISSLGLPACVASGEADVEGGLRIDERTGGDACAAVEGLLKDVVKRSASLDRGSSGDGADDSPGGADDDGTTDQGSGDR